MTNFKWRKIATTALVSTLFLSPAIITAQTMHTVVQGDTIYDLAQAYGTSEEELMAWNGLSHPNLDVGMELIVQNPAGDTEAPSDDVVADATAGSHIVQSGDTLSGIAAVYGVTVDELYAWNGLTDSFLQIGDVIAVSPDGSSNVSSIPASSSTPEASYYPSVATSGNYLTVQPGDTLSGLAWAYGTTVEAFMGANGLTSDWIIAGQQLAVPADAIYQDPNRFTQPSNTGADFTPSQTKENATADINGGTSHIVEPGDTFSSIATTYGVAVDDIYSWNPDASSEDLTVGQAITVQPGGPVNSQENMQVEDNDGDRRVIDLSRIPENVRPETHVVKAGDNIWRIAEQYNVSADSIRMWNELPEGNDSLRIGETIFVSNPAFVPEMHEVEENESVEDIANATEITVENIIKWNELDNEEDISVGDILFVSNPRPLTHNVEPGETLEEIAENYNIDVADLRQWNYLPENSRIINGTLIVSNPKEDVISSNQSEQSSDASEQSNSDESGEATISDES
ncbi:LysM peptidoglycan-binding domain-containing protein [Aerococcaceae bacterium DSM 111020]|nr:LysM peptidoglycan-binding domain-containing protein [Aerococcaceae bacterium DSM 111020]